MPRIFDSGDPNYPNLPHDFSDFSGSEEFSDVESVASGPQERKNSRQYLYEEPVASPGQSHLSPHLESHPFEDDEKPVDPITPIAGTNLAKKKRSHNHRRRNRKYSDSAYSSTAAKKRISWEPGIDINTTDVVISSIGSSVTVTDYRADRYRVEHTEVFSNILNTIDVETSDTDFYLNKEASSSEYDIKSKQSVAKFKQMLDKRPSWSKVRWINVNGLSWEAIATIGEKYDLHRLAIEDMIDIPQRTKTDIYSGHLFGVLPVIKLVRSKKHEPSNYNSLWNKILKTLNLYNYTDEEQEKDDDVKYGGPKVLSLTEKINSSKEMRRLNETVGGPSGLSKRRRQRLLDSQRPLSYRDLFVGLEQCSFFLLKDNTVISFFESTGDDIEHAILGRISTEETILRTSCDPSILIQSIIDAVVDIIYPVITAYKKRLGELEVDVLTNSNLGHIATLHLMTGELSKLRTSIVPTTVLINSLKDQSKKNKGLEVKSGASTRKDLTPSSFITPSAELYLADVSDHTQMYTDEIEGMISSIENLIGLIFNTTSNESNSAMQQLSLVTVIFLPLSFWTGYYGMNFESFGDLEHNVSYYWKIAVPFSCGLLILITWSMIKRWLMETRRTIKRTIQDIKINRDFKKRQKKKQERLQRRASTMTHKSGNMV